MEASDRFIRRLLQTSAGPVTVEGAWFGLHLTRYDESGEFVAQDWASLQGLVEEMDLAEALRRLGVPAAEVDPIAAELEARLAELRPPPASRWTRLWSKAKYVALLSPLVVPWGVGLARLAARIVRRGRG
jgi:hypothetical protein